jgi:hypothetical protein
LTLASGSIIFVLPGFNQPYFFPAGYYYAAMITVSVTNMNAKKH